MTRTPGETKVLIIEDEPMLLDIAVRSFSRAGFQVLPAPDGHEGIRIAGEKHPDVILLDIIMPGISGYDVLTHLKSTEKTMDIPVIMFSNLALEREREKAIELGAIDFMIKADHTLMDAVTRVSLLLSVTPNTSAKK